MSSNIAAELPIDPGEGWELLKEQEPLRPGDGFLHPVYERWIDYACRPDLFRGENEYAHLWPWRREIKAPSVSVETKTEAQLEEVFREADQIREDLGKQEPSSDRVAAVLQNARPRQFVRMRGEFEIMMCDGCGEEFDTGCQGITTSDGFELCLNCQSESEWQSRYDAEWTLKPNASAAPISALEGTPYGPSVVVRGGEYATGASFPKSESLTKPASGKFKMSIFEELLKESQNAADCLTGWPIGCAHYELGIRLQLAIERASR